MAKKRRSAKQKAATRKLVAFNRRKGSKKRKSKRSAPKRRKSSRKSNKRRTTKPKRKKMAKGGKKSFIDKIPILKNKTVQKIGFGLGMGVVVLNVIDLISRIGPPQLTAPLAQNKRIIQLGVELATEPLSALVDVGLNSGALSGVLGRNGGNVSNGNNAGFA